LRKISSTPAPAILKKVSMFRIGSGSGNFLK
jgi:hypothetical protein